MPSRMKESRYRIQAWAGGEKKSNSICVQLGAISSQPRFRTEVLAALMPSSSLVRLVLHVLRLLSNKRPIGDQGVCSKTKEQTIKIKKTTSGRQRI